MSFTPDIEGEGIGNEANKIVADFCLNESIKTQNRLHVCGASCPGCGNEAQEAEDRINWYDRIGKWAMSLAVRPRVEYNEEDFPVSKPNRRKKKK